MVGHPRSNASRRLFSTQTRESQSKLSSRLHYSSLGCLNRLIDEDTDLTLQGILDGLLKAEEGEADGEAEQGDRAGEGGSAGYEAPGEPALHLSTETESFGSV